jgi:urate oxidase
MTAIKIAVTVPEEVLKRAKSHVKAGKAKTLSSLVSEAVEEKVARDELAEILAEMDAERGPPPKAARAWAKRFLERNARLVRARIDLTEHLWHRIPRGEREHGHAFARTGPETRTATIQSQRRRTIVGAGIADLLVLKSAGSAFDNFMRDEYTTLPDTRDRILSTSLTATWRYRDLDVEFTPTWNAVRRMLLDVFAEHQSESVQHTLYAMGQAVLDNIDIVAGIRIVMPNKHHLPVDLSRLGLPNRNEVFVPTDEPYGLIEATLTR